MPFADPSALAFAIVGVGHAVAAANRAHDVRAQARHDAEWAGKIGSEGHAGRQLAELVRPAGEREKTPALLADARRAWRACQPDRQRQCDRSRNSKDPGHPLSSPARIAGNSPAARSPAGGPRLRVKNRQQSRGAADGGSALAVVAFADPGHHALAIVAEGLAVAAADRPKDLDTGIRPGGAAPLYIGREAHPRLQLTEFVRATRLRSKPAALVTDPRRTGRARQPKHKSNHSGSPNSENLCHRARPLCPPAN